MTRASTFATAFALAALAFGCEGGSDAAKKPAKAVGGGAGAGSTSDDDLTLDEAVPMALLDPSFLAEVRRNISPIAGTASWDANGDAARVAKETATSEVLAAPGRMTSELSRLLGYTQSLYEALFAPGGLLGGRTLDLATGATRSFPFTLVDGRSGFVRLTNAGAANPYRYAAQVSFRSDLGLIPTLSLRFTPATETKTALVDLTQWVELSGNSSWQYLHATYDTSKRLLTAEYAIVPPTTALPSAGAFRYAFDTVASTVSISGAHVWRAQAPLAAGFYPRFYDLADGDVEAFRLVFSSASDGPALQELAFAAAADAATLAALEAGTAFSPYSYAQLAADFLTTVLRTESVNPACKTSGRRIRDGVEAAGKTEPQAVTALPDDLCVSNAQLLDGELVAGISAACDLVRIVLPVRDGNGSQVDFDVCNTRDEVALLKNPQALAADGAGKRLLLPYDGLTPPPPFEGLTGLLGGVAMPSLAILSSPPASPPSAADAAEFSDAQAVP